VEKLIQKIKNKIQNKNIILVDGLNILKHVKGVNNFSNLDIVRIWGKENGVSPIFLLPGFNKFRKRYGQNNDVILINPRIYDDIAILAYAQELDVAILSNDKFREFRKMFKDLDFNRVFSYRIRNGNIITNATDYFFFQDSTFYAKTDLERTLGVVQ